ncbi:hypothetical protein PSEUBRA_001105 [Kalmanozyma brasiliensis GHG001]|uniref:uncharacterized protein n=1 Tax=Kalmanozyma brasiliensis (strain GHG001) TaxID=1365824 RepID=UPI002867EB4C|nr:uncharacterized protein PSEUBRA_001105 [Kalmanozyma brasiliensis GHG001]KAF6766891.1 hypothetical protein PSEUBRA_001105 [Kalmanozyma brasiliensis GHG001]
MSTPSITLTHAFTLKLPVAAALSIPGTPVGDRSYIPVVEGGTLEGEGISAKVTPGGDWAIVKDGYGKLDVRVHAITPDNEVLYIQYSGHLEVTPAVGKILGADASAKSTNFDDQYLLTTPVIEAPANSKHAWVNRTVFVGKGRFELDGNTVTVIYELFKAK